MLEIHTIEYLIKAMKYENKQLIYIIQIRQINQKQKEMLSGDWICLLSMIVYCPEALVCKGWSYKLNK